MNVLPHVYMCAMCTIYVCVLCVPCIYVYYMCLVCMYTMCTMYVCVLCVSEALGGQKAHWLSSPGSTDHCDMPHGYWKPNLDPLQKQRVLLDIQAMLEPHPPYFLRQGLLLIPGTLILG